MADTWWHAGDRDAEPGFSRPAHVRRAFVGRLSYSAPLASVHRTHARRAGRTGGTDPDCDDVSAGAFVLDVFDAPPVTVWRASARWFVEILRPVFECRPARCV